MNTEQILESIDAELARLEQAKQLLGGTAAPAKPGRPKKSAPAKAAVQKKEKKAGKRTMSAEGRARIAAAQKARWAKAKGKRGA